MPIPGNVMLLDSYIWRNAGYEMVTIIYCHMYLINYKTRRKKRWKVIITYGMAKDTVETPLTVT